MLHLRNFVLQAGDVRGGRGFLRLQFGGIEHRDQVSRLYRRAFIHQQFLDAAFHLRADDHLVRVDRADQHQIFGMVGGESIIDRGDHEDDAEKNEEAVASTHLRTPDLRTTAQRWNRAETAPRK